MVMLPIEPRPFFANKDRAFWNLQLAGWGGAFLLRAITAFANDQPWDFLVILLIQVVTGFSLSLILSVIYRQLITRRALVTWGVTVLALASAAGVHAFIDGWVLDLARPQSEGNFVRLFLGVYFYDLTVLGEADEFVAGFEEVVDELVDCQFALVPEHARMSAVFEALEQPGQYPIHLDRLEVEIANLGQAKLAILLL